MIRQARTFEPKSACCRQAMAACLAFSLSWTGTLSSRSNMISSAFNPRALCTMRSRLAGTESTLRRKRVLCIFPSIIAALPEAKLKAHFFSPFWGTSPSFS